MKPDIGAYMKAPWKGIPLLRDALALLQELCVGACHQIIDLGQMLETAHTQVLPMDGAIHNTPLVITRDPVSREHKWGCTEDRFTQREIGLHWQIHKHG